MKRVLVLVALVAGATAAPARADTLAPGCAPGRPAVAHHAGGKVVADAPAPVPCTTQTGYYTGETGIAVTPGGTLWFSAADWEWALARTRDLGAHWERFGVPGPQAYPGCGAAVSGVSQCDTSESGKNNTVADAFLHVDRDTGRTFWTKTYGYALCSSLNYGDENGTWGATPSAGCPGGDYEKVAAGPPPAGGEKPTGYANVVYLCTNGPAPTFVVGPARVCFKSLDGGATFANAGVPAVPSPQAPGCLHFQEQQVVSRDGTVYLPLNCGAAGVLVAISHDEAQTWSYSTVPVGDAGNGAGVVGGVSMAVDDAGTLYVVWPGSDKHTRLAISRDHGATWKGPLLAGPPGVTLGSPNPQVAARAPGHIAIGSYGSTSDPKKLNGYLTESFDAEAADPLFYTATVNDPADPLYFPTDGGSLPRNDYLGVTIGPDETPWTGLVKLTSAKPDSQGFVQSTGVASRLTFAPYVPDGATAAQQIGAAAAPHGTQQATTTANLQCTRGLVLTEVLEGRNRVHLAGVAKAGFVGRRVAIVFATAKRTVARATVRPDGTFETTAPLPAARLRASNGARYRAEVGRQRSPAFKLRRRLLIDDLSARNGRVTIAGRVLNPARRAQPVIVRRRVTCRRLATVARVRPRRDGRFRVTVTAPRSAAAAVYRLQTRVPHSARDPRLHATYTLTPAVELVR